MEYEGTLLNRYLVFLFLMEFQNEVSPLLWSSEILDYTIPEENQDYAEKELHPGV